MGPVEIAPTDGAGTVFARVDDATTYKFFYLVAADEGWVRCAKVIAEAFSYDLAVDMFWTALDVEYADAPDGVDVLMAGCIHADIRAEDFGGWSLGHQPVLTDSELAQASAEVSAADIAGECRAYTVFAAWDSDGTGHRRLVEVISAPSWGHAEAMLRYECDGGDLQIAGTVAGSWPSEDQGQYEYATIDGLPPVPYEEEPRGFWRRLLGRR